MLRLDCSWPIHRFSAIARRALIKAWRHIDAVVSGWAKRHGLAQLIHSPSLAQHIGGTTTIGPLEQDAVPRVSHSFVGESWNAVAWLECEEPGGELLGANLQVQPSRPPIS